VPRETALRVVPCACERQGDPRAKGKAMRKKLLLSGGVSLLVLAIGLGAFLFYIDRIARQAIERGGTYALGVETRLESADLGLFAGDFAMEGLEVDNPEGFASERFLRLDRGTAAVQMGSLAGERVEIPTIRLEGVRMVLEKREGEANYEAILSNLRKLKDGEGDADAPPPADREDGKSFVIRELVIEDAEVEIELLPVGGELTRTTVPLERIRLTHIGAEEGGARMGELSGVVVQALLGATLRKAGALPQQLAGELGKGLQGVGRIAGGSLEVGGETLGGIADVTGELAEGAAKTIGGAAEKAGKALEKLGEGIGEALGDEKNKPNKKKDGSSQ
jgi:hypothetical protein